MRIRKKITNEVFEDLGKVAIAGFVSYVLYEVFKWGIATLLAPGTGGISWVVAGCAP